MPGHEAVVLHLDGVVFVIKRRDVKRIAHHLSPMLPTAVEVVVVVIIATAYLQANVVSLVVIHRARLILRVKILHHDIL